MITRVPDHTTAVSGVAWSAQRPETGKATERGQDKRAHIALRSVGCFCRDFCSILHIAAFPGNVRRWTKILYRKGFPHIAEALHAR